MWNKYPDVRPAEYGKYEIYRSKCGKQNFETWNNTGWAYNNNDITHWREIKSPIESKAEERTFSLEDVKNAILYGADLADKFCGVPSELKNYIEFEQQKYFKDQFGIIL